MSWSTPFIGFVRAFRHPVISRLALSFLLFQLGFALYYIYILVRMTQSYGLSAAQLGLFSALFGAGFTLGSVAGYRLAARVLKTDRRVSIAGLSVCAVFILLAGLPVPAIVQWPLAFLAALSNLVAFIGILTMIGSAVSDAERGWALGIGGSMTAVAFFVSGMMALVEAYISTEWLILAGALVVALGVPPLLRMSEPAPVAPVPAAP
jgi:MFS transporter, DHA1 family, tetracycline resistance protein